MTLHYILKGHEPVPCDLMTWARSLNSSNRIVARTTVGDSRVSTVFLGLDHGFGHGPPILFETMIFGGPHDQYQERCSTWEEAEAEHAKAVKLVEEQK